MRRVRALAEELGNRLMIFSTGLLTVALWLGLLLASGGASAETYHYDAAGRLKHVVYPDGSSLAFAYDARSNVLSRLASAPGTDTDGDGLTDAVETGTGTLLSATDTGTDPNAADSDGDGASDGDEVAAGTNPHDSAEFPTVAVPALAPASILFVAGLLGVLAFFAARSRRKAQGRDGGGLGGFVIALVVAGGSIMLAPSARACVNHLGSGNWAANNMAVGGSLTSQLSQLNGFSTATQTVTLESPVFSPTSATFSFHVSTQVAGFGNQITASVIYDFRNAIGNSLASEI
ncbi:MAG: hypothetical protein VCB42_05770, partial [Myxococcota bacterium]